MPGNSLRLTIGLLVLLGIMLLASRLPVGQGGEPPVPEAVQRQLEEQRNREEGLRRQTAAALQAAQATPAKEANPYLARHQREGADCHGDVAQRELDVLRGDRERLVNTVNFIRIDDESTLDMFTDITNPLVSMELTYCLRQAQNHLYRAAEAARDRYRAGRRRNPPPSDAEIRNAMDDAMQESLHKAEQEFALVEASLRQGE